MKNIPIGEVLREDGYISQKQIDEALKYQKSSGKRLGSILIDMGFVTEKQVLEALGKRLGLSMESLSRSSVDIDAVSKIPRQIAAKYNAVAVKEDNGRLIVAMSDPLDFYAQEDIKQITGMPVEIVLAESDSIKNTISRAYSEAEARIAAHQANISASENQMPEAEILTDDDDAPVIKLINSLLEMGDNRNISDIHIEPFEENTSVRIRKDGLIIDYVTLSKSVHQSVIARIKIMADLDIAEKRLPQDGHFKTVINNSAINIRVSVIPTVFGEKAVLRFLSSDSKLLDNCSQFGMDNFAFNTVNRMLSAPYGIIYITGPTGSGKTTTLYMMLEKLAEKPVNISTIEDPVEKNIRKVNQMQVNNTAGLTFDKGLRAILRQDPDIIMVGETRDSETAAVSVRSAITGHLVLSTLHTNDAVSSIVRLRDMGVPDYLLASSLTGIIAQRLVRKICRHCSYDDIPTDEEKFILGDDTKTVRRAKGCSHCSNTGYHGRIAIHEILFIDRNIRNMIADGVNIQKIYDYTLNVQHMTTLKTAALKLVRDNITTVDEFLRVTYGAE